MNYRLVHWTFWFVDGHLRWFWNASTGRRGFENGSKLPLGDCANWKEKSFYRNFKI